MIMHIIVMLVVRMITPPTSGTTTGIIIIILLLLLLSTLNFNVESKVFVKGVDAVSVVALLHSSVKSVSVPGTVQLNFAACSIRNKS